MTDKHVPVTPELHEYLLSLTLREPECLARLREEMEAHPWGQMAAPPEVGQFLAMLVRLTGATRVLELGTFMGYTALWMAQALPTGGRLLTLDINRDWNAVARRHWREAGVEDRIEARLSPALVELERLRAAGEEGRFDMVFLDADKRNYPAYAESLLSLLRPGGLLVVDNVLWGGRIQDPELADSYVQGIRQFNEWLCKEPGISVSAVPLGDGLLLAVKI